MTTTTNLFAVPARENVSETNQGIFDQMQRNLGMVPNLYATFAHSDTALADYLALQNRQSSLSGKEKEVINLVVSQANECRYCLSAHTLLAQKQGFSAEQVLEIRSGRASFDERLDQLAQFTRAVVQQRGNVNTEQREQLIAAGYTAENIVDIVMAVGDKTITNYLHNVTEVPIDFPLAEDLGE